MMRLERSPILGGYVSMKEVQLDTAVKILQDAVTLDSEDTQGSWTCRTC